MGYQLFPHQRQLVDRTWAAFQTHQGVMVVSPAGSGKSVIIADMIKTMTDRHQFVLFMVHRKELIAQIQQDLQTNAVNMAYVKVSSVFKLQRNMKKLTDFQPALIVTDETHHAKAKSYLDIYRFWPRAQRLGFTATPVRLSGEGFGDVYDTLVEGPSVKWLIDHHYLAPFTYYSVPVLERNKLKKRRGEYTNQSISEALKAAGGAVFGKVVETFQQRARGSQAILYAHSVNYSKRYARQFHTAGINAVHVDSKTPAKERDQIMAAFKRHEIQILCNVDLVSEGFNVPECSTVILLRPTESLTVFVQQAMRSMRYLPKKQAVIIDHVGNYLKHGLPDTERAWSLDPSQVPRPTDEERPVCPKCHAVFPRWHETTTATAIIKACPVCGFQIKEAVAEVLPPEVFGEGSGLLEDPTVELAEITAEERAYLQVKQFSHQNHTRYRRDLVKIADIFVARNRLAEYEHRRPPYKLPIFFAIREFLNLNDVRALKPAEVDQMVARLVDRYGEAYDLYLPSVKRYVKRLMPEYLHGTGKQPSKSEQGGR